MAFLRTITVSVKASSLVMQFRMRFSTRSISLLERGETSGAHVMVLFVMIGSSPGNAEVADILNEDHIKPAESLGNTKQNTFTLHVCSIIY